MTTAEIVEISQKEDENQYFLPKHCGDLITRRAGNSNLGVYTQEIPLLTQCALEPVLEGFRTGQGVGYERYPKFQAFMTQLADAKHRRTLISTFLPSVNQGRLYTGTIRGIEQANVPFCAPMQQYHGLVGAMNESGAECMVLPMLRSARANRPGSRPIVILPCCVVKQTNRRQRLLSWHPPGIY